MQTYNGKEIAKMLNTSPETVRRWIRCGKLDAIQQSRKGGNVVTEAMLDAFLKSSPKYSGIAAGFLSTPIGLTAATATLVGAILAKQVIKNNQVKYAQVEAEEIRKLLLSNIHTSQVTIKRKKESIRQLQEEITVEQQHIDESRKLIEELDAQLTSNKIKKGDQSNDP